MNYIEYKCKEEIFIGYWILRNFYCFIENLIKFVGIEDIYTNFGIILINLSLIFVLNCSTQLIITQLIIMSYLVVLKLSNRVPGQSRIMIRESFSMVVCLLIYDNIHKLQFKWCQYLCINLRHILYYYYYANVLRDH